jgi:hypothetical protein
LWEQRQVWTDWLKSWDIIVPVDGGIVMYDRTQGHANLYALNVDGLWEQRQVWTDWLKSWDIIVPVDGGIVMYDRTQGHANLYALEMY